MTDDPNSHLAKAPDQPPKHIPEASHWDQMEKREGLLWRYILGILIVMALGLAVTSWETFRVLPMRLEAAQQQIVQALAAGTQGLQQFRAIRRGELGGLARRGLGGITLPTQDLGPSH